MKHLATNILLHYSHPIHGLNVSVSNLHSNVPATLTLSVILAEVPKTVAEALARISIICTQRKNIFITQANSMPHNDSY